MGEWTGWAVLHRASQDGSLIVMLHYTGCFLGMAMTGAGLVGLLLEAIQRAGLTEQQACLEMGINQAQWHRQKQGLERNYVALQRVERLPDRVLAELAALLYQEHGPLDYIESAAALHFGKKRMVKAQLPDTEQEDRCGTVSVAS